MPAQILLIDDNSDDIHLTARALTKAFAELGETHEVIVAKDGVEALGAFFGNGPFAKGETGALPKLILLDLKMPKLGGLEVLQCIRFEPRMKDIPVLILTSSRADLDIEDSRTLGADGFLQKPLNVPEFKEALSRLGLIEVEESGARKPRPGDR